MSSFVIINNSFSVKRPHLPPPSKKYMKSHLWQLTISKFSGGAYPRTPPRLAYPSVESGFALIYAARYALLDACENFC